jgi:predicted alpha/beta superfamily hydrolase
VPDDRPALGGTEVVDVRSAEVGATFRVFLGRCGDEPATTLFVVDGNGLFGLAVDVVRLMQIPGLLPSVLVVGVGYPDVVGVLDTIGTRERDLTPTHWPAFPGSGGADRFLAFLDGSLAGLLDERFPGCLRTAVLFGHSLGGLFGVHALLQEAPPFTHYVLSSPSLFWDHRVVFAEEERRAASGRDLRAAAFVGIGALEDDAGRRRETRNLPDGHRHKAAGTRLDMVDDVLRFTERLLSRGYPSLELQVAVFPDEFHATVPAVVLAHGLRHLFADAAPLSS